MSPHLGPGVAGLEPDNEDSDGGGGGGEGGGVLCWCYTHARRHPLVLGRIAGWTPPFQLSVTQLGVLCAAIAAAVLTRPVWQLLPGGGVLVLVGVVVVTWAARRVHVEHRSLFAGLAGWARWAFRPRRGTVLWPEPRWSTRRPRGVRVGGGR